MLWTKSKIEWLTTVAVTPNRHTRRLPSHTEIAKIASEYFGEPVSRHQVRHALARRKPVDDTDDTDDTPPDVAILLTRLSALEKQLDRERDRSAIIVDAIRQTVVALPQLKPLAATPSPKDEDLHAAMVDISDLHIGEKVDARLTGALSEYNFDIFKLRLERYRLGFDRLVQIQRRAYPIDELFVNLLGDIVTGEAIYEGQAFHIDMPLLAQVFEGGYHLAGLIRHFARLFKQVHIRAVGGNHGRGGRKGQNHPLTNWDLAVYELLRILLSDQPNVTFEVSDTSFLVYRVPGHERYRHVLIHGQQARSYLGLPYYGVERVGGKMSSMLGLTLEYLHMGHHHTEANWPVNRTEFLLNGSWVGGSDLSINQMQRLTRPTQNLFFLHPKRGVVLAPKIQLDHWTEMAPDERGIYRPQT